MEGERGENDKPETKQIVEHAKCRGKNVRNGTNWTENKLEG